MLEPSSARGRRRRTDEGAGPAAWERSRSTPRKWERSQHRLHGTVGATHVPDKTVDERRWDTVTEGLVRGLSVGAWNVVRGPARLRKVSMCKAFRTARGSRQ
ncbi:hypothetical protein ACE1SV_01240 [Streptomyces sennicomposti]